MKLALSHPRSGFNIFLSKELAERIAKTADVDSPQDVYLALIKATKESNKLVVTLGIVGTFTKHFKGPYSSIGVQENGSYEYRASFGVKSLKAFPSQLFGITEAQYEIDGKRLILTTDNLDSLPEAVSRHRKQEVATPPSAPVASVSAPEPTAPLIVELPNRAEDFQCSHARRIPHGDGNDREGLVSQMSKSDELVEQSLVFTEGLSVPRRRRESASMSYTLSRLCFGFAAVPWIVFIFGAFLNPYNMNPPETLALVGQIWLLMTTGLFLIGGAIFSERERRLK